MFGGQGPYQHGGAGTVYIESHFVNPHTKHFISDNHGYSSSNRINEVERLNLTGIKSNYVKTVYMQNGINVTTDAPSYSYYNYWYYLSHLFSDTKANVKNIYLANSKEATLTFDLPFKTYIEYLRVYPYCERFAKFLFIEYMTILQ